MKASLMFQLSRLGGLWRILRGLMLALNPVACMQRMIPSSSPLPARPLRARRLVVALLMAAGAVACSDSCQREAEPASQTSQGRRCDDAAGDRTFASETHGDRFEATQDGGFSAGLFNAQPDPFDGPPATHTVVGLPFACDGTYTVTLHDESWGARFDEADDGGGGELFQTTPFAFTEVAVADREGGAFAEVTGEPMAEVNGAGQLIGATLTARGGAQSGERLQLRFVSAEPACRPYRVTVSVLCAPPPLEICDNGEDDDGDEATDCADPDCAADPTCDGEVCQHGFDNPDDAAGAFEAFPEFTSCLQVTQSATPYFQQLLACEGSTMQAEAADVAPGAEVVIVTADALGDEQLPFVPIDEAVLQEFVEESEVFIVVQAPDQPMCTPGEIKIVIDNGDGLGGNPSSGSSPFSAAPATTYRATVNPYLPPQFEINPPEEDEEGCPVRVFIEVDEDPRPGMLVVPISGFKIAEDGTVVAEDAFDPADALPTISQEAYGRILFAADALEEDPQTGQRGRLALRADDTVFKRDAPLGSCFDMSFSYVRDCAVPPECAPLDCARPACAALPDCDPANTPEDCDNGEDDDGDGDIDCEDDACADDPACAMGDACATEAPGEAPGGYGEALLGWLVESETAPGVGLCQYDPCDQWIGFERRIVINQPKFTVNRFDDSSLLRDTFLWPQALPSGGAVRTVAYAPNDLIDEPFECPAVFDPGLTEYADFQTEIPDLSAFTGTPILIGAGTPDPICGDGFDAPCPEERAPGFHIFETTCEPNDEVAQVRVGNFIPNSGDLAVDVLRGDELVASVGGGIGFGEVSDYVALAPATPGGDDVIVDFAVTDGARGQQFRVGTFDFYNRAWNVTERLRPGQCVLIALSGRYAAPTATIKAAAMLEAPTVCEAWNRSSNIPPMLYPACLAEE